MMVVYQATECAFEVDSSWVDQTGYIYVDGVVRAVAGTFCPIEVWPEKLDRALRRFELAVPGYSLIERARLDRPAPGAERVCHRMGGAQPSFEASLFWPLGGSVWVFRVSGPVESEARCRLVLESFLGSYQRIEES